MDPGYLDMNADVATYAATTVDTSYEVYGGLEMNVLSFGHGKAKRPMLHAAACGVYHEGATDIYLFNFDCHAPSLPFTPQYKQSLREIGNGHLLVGKDKHYFIVCDIRG